MGAESDGKLPHLFIPSKTAAWVPEFAMEDLPLGRIAALVPEFVVKDLALGRIRMIYIVFLIRAMCFSRLIIFCTPYLFQSRNICFINYLRRISGKFGMF